MARKRRETLRLKKKGENVVAENIDVDAAFNLNADLDATSAPQSSPALLQRYEHLLKGEWLNDSMINEGQRLIQQEFPHLQGLQDVALGHTMAFSVERGEFVQILHAGGHWVTISTIGCGPAEVDIYDSSSPQLTSLLQQQIAALLCTTEKAITVR